MGGGRRWERRYPKGHPGWKPKASTFPIAYQRDSVNDFAYRLMDPHRPTTGLQALFTFVLMCSKIDIFGFSGSGTADGHGVSKKHSLKREHTILKNFFSGSQARADNFS